MRFLFKKVFYEPLFPLIPLGCLHNKRFKLATYLNDQGESGEKGELYNFFRKEAIKEDDEFLSHLLDCFKVKTIDQEKPTEQPLTKPYEHVYYWKCIGFVRVICKPVKTDYKDSVIYELRINKTKKHLEGVKSFLNSNKKNIISYVEPPNFLYCGCPTREILGDLKLLLSCSPQRIEDCSLLEVLKFVHTDCYQLFFDQDLLIEFIRFLKREKRIA